METFVRAGGAAALLIAITVVSAPVQARSTISVSALLARAAHDTNTVRTLIHHDVSTISTSQGTIIKFTAVGEEDETHNRERDSESVTVSALQKHGPAKKVRYTATAIFLSGKTYFRVSVGKAPPAGTGGFQVRQGSTFPDPYTGGFKRGRTTVPSSGKFTLVGKTGSEAHIRGPYKVSGAHGTIDLWISGGTTPYVVREDQSLTGKSGPLTETIHIHSTLGPFNTLIVIEPPAKGA